MNQMFFIIGALVMLTLVTGSVNSMLTSKNQTMLFAEANLMAISIAQSMIDEIQTKKFDQRVVPDTARVFQDSTQFTPSASFGPDASEGTHVPLPESPDTASSYKSLKYYDDISDYQGYRRYVWTSMGVFAVTDSIYYVTTANPDQYSGVQTFLKRIVVTVRHPNITPLGKTYNPWSGPGYFQQYDVAVYRNYF